MIALIHIRCFCVSAYELLVLVCIELLEGILMVLFIELEAYRFH